MGSTRRFRDPRSAFSDLLPYGAMVADGVVLNKDGALMTAWRVESRDAASLTEDERNALASRVNAALIRLGTGTMIHIDAVRRASTRYAGASSRFPDRVSAWVDAERRANFERLGGHFETETIWTLTWTAPEVANSRLASAMFEGGHGENNDAGAILAAFERFIADFEDQAGSAVRLHRLRSYVECDAARFPVRYDPLLAHLRRCITGEDAPVRRPNRPMYLDGMLSETFEHGVTPRIGDRLIGVVAIDAFPDESTPMMLAPLDQMGLAYRWSTRFIPLDPHEARARLEGYRKKWAQRTRSLFEQVFKLNPNRLDGDAVEMVVDAESAMNEAAGAQVVFGYYTGVIVLTGEDVEQLDRDLREVRRAIANLGFGARIEELNATEAYLGSLPGSGHPNLRRPMLHSMNVVDIAPLSTTWTGRSIAPCPFYPPNSPSLLEAATDGTTPFHLNLHVDDLGHTLVFGPTGSGKSTLLGLIVAQFRRYPGATVACFDKGRSMEALTSACGGAHYDVGGDESALAFHPLGRLDDDVEQAWAEEWIATLAVLQKVEMNAERRAAIHRAVTLMRAGGGARTLSDLHATLQDPDLRSALAFYTVGGALGRLLDAEEEGLEQRAFTTFEIEHLMAMGPEALMPILLYLFHRVERSLTGQPSLIVLDEAWIMLGHEAFRAKIREWLKVLRKANCAVVLATQSLSDAARSGILDVLVESCPTRIFLPNASATQETARELYRSLGLNPHQIEQIAAARPKREYYVTSPEGVRLIDLELGPLALAFVGVSSKDDLAAIAALRRTHGAAWPEAWLRLRGVAPPELEDHPPLEVASVDDATPRTSLPPKREGEIHDAA